MTSYGKPGKVGKGFVVRTEKESIKIFDLVAITVGPFYVMRQNVYQYIYMDLSLKLILNVFFDVPL